MPCHPQYTTSIVGRVCTGPPLKFRLSPPAIGRLALGPHLNSGCSFKNAREKKYSRMLFVRTLTCARIAGVICTRIACTFDERPPAPGACGCEELTVGTLAPPPPQAERNVGCRRRQRESQLLQLHTSTLRKECSGRYFYRRGAALKECEKQLNRGQLSGGRGAPIPQRARDVRELRRFRSVLPRRWTGAASPARRSRSFRRFCCSRHALRAGA